MSTNIAGDDSDSLKVGQQWEIVEASPENESNSVISISSDGEANAENGDFVSQAEGFQESHAKAMAQIEADEGARDVSPPLPVSKEAYDSDTHAISSEGYLSGYSSKNSEFESFERMDGAPILPKSEERNVSTQVEQSNKVEPMEPDSPQAVSALKELSQEGSLEGSFVDKCLSDHGAAKGGGDDSGRSLDQGSEHGGADDLNKQISLHSPAWLAFWLRKWSLLMEYAFPRGIWESSLGPFHSAINDVNWRAFSRNAGMAMMSAVAVGLIVRNRKLAFDLRRKQEEVTRLMVALMNFQELWAANRSHAPVLRHASLLVL